MTLRIGVNYHELYDDMRLPGRWHLRTPVDEHGQWLDTWQFKEGRVLEFQSPILFPIKPPGVPLEFTLTSFTIPVVHGRVVSLFERLGIQEEVQFIPVWLEGQEGPYFILNALRVIPCIDEARCEEVLHWLPEDGEPERVGQYRNVQGLKIDPAKVGSAHIFRPWGWLVSLIVSERVRSAMEDEGITGARFIEV